MIYGKGLIAKSFSKYKKNRKFIFFASGVSNSLETNFSKYNREIQLLKKVLFKKKRKQIFVYFSSCSVLDPSKKNSLYVKHKLKIENIIKNFDYYYIFRLPNVVGKTSNNFTLINNLIYKLRNNKKIVAYFGATRNIIDVKDVVSIIDLILKIDPSKNKIINIANKYNNKIIDIISYLSTMFKSQSFIISKKYLIKSSYIINVNYIKKYINLLNIKFHKNYYKEVLNKYYVTKN